jgi:ABC-type transport system involved in multi-copper enzyme maturation permease subunit
MTASLKAEFRKLLTVRSTYVILGFSIAMIILFAFYGGGLRYSGPLNNPFILQQQVLDAVNGMALFVALIGILLITHEYRYNTIMYTLTASKSRTRTLLAKFIAISLASLLLILLIGALSPLLTALGLSVKGVHVAHQTIYYRDLLLKVAFYGWSYAMIAAILAIIIRNQIGAIASLFLIPAMVQPLFGLVLKENRVYLPFTALNSVIGQHEGAAGLAVTRAAVVSLIYIVIGATIAWLLFLRRDAA